MKLFSFDNPEELKDFLGKKHKKDVASDDPRKSKIEYPRTKLDDMMDETAESEIVKESSTTEEVAETESGFETKKSSVSKLDGKIKEIKITIEHVMESGKKRKLEYATNAYFLTFLTEEEHEGESVEGTMSSSGGSVRNLVKVMNGAGRGIKAGLKEIIGKLSAELDEILKKKK